MEAKRAAMHFACTMCGKCCNRSPEVELSEAAALADVFVFRLMFRLYWLAQQPEDRLGSAAGIQNSKAAFYEKKRLLSAFAARKSPTKVLREGKRVAYTKYLVISALALDTSNGQCAALRGTRCSIYDRRPLSCRSVPLHYSRAEASAETDLEAFVRTSGFECDTSEAAPIVLEGGQIVAPTLRQARSEAISVAEKDRRWSEAIARRMSGSSSSAPILPSLQEVEASSQSGATTISMRPAWQIAADLGLLSPEECNRLIALQIGVIDQELAQTRASMDARETLAEMSNEYRQYLNGNPVVLNR